MVAAVAAWVAVPVTEAAAMVMVGLVAVEAATVEVEAPEARHAGRPAGSAERVTEAEDMEAKVGVATEPETAVVDAVAEAAMAVAQTAKTAAAAEVVSKVQQSVATPAAVVVTTAVVAVDAATPEDAVSPTADMRCQ